MRFDLRVRHGRNGNAIIDVHGIQIRDVGRDLVVDGIQRDTNAERATNGTAAGTGRNPDRTSEPKGTDRGIVGCAE